METYLKLIPKDKIALVDLKNWRFPFKNSHLIDVNYLANKFMRTIGPYSSQDNIYVQSYDVKLIEEIIKRTDEESKIKLGVIVKYEYQLQEAISLAEKYKGKVNFISIEQKLLDKYNIDFLRKYFIKIFGWNEIFDRKETQEQQIEHSELSGCDANISSKRNLSLIKFIKQQL